MIGNQSQGFSGWLHATFNYKATSSQEILSFLSRGTPTGLPPIALLDGVSLYDTGATPEPATWAMMILGMAGIGAALRRRRGGQTA